ncbi:MAG: hypothetical protein ACOH12_09010 [Parvibaculaceae bacterium]
MTEQQPQKDDNGDRDTNEKEEQRAHDEPFMLYFRTQIPANIFVYAGAVVLALIGRRLISQLIILQARDCVIIFGK